MQRCRIVVALVCATGGARRSPDEAERGGCADPGEPNYHWLKPIPRMNVGASVTIVDGPPAVQQAGEKRKREEGESGK